MMILSCLIQLYLYFTNTKSQMYYQNFCVKWMHLSLEVKEVLLQKYENPKNEDL